MCCIMCFLHSIDKSLLQDTSPPPLLLLFLNPINAVWDAFVQTAGYIDSAAFFAPYLFYPELTSIMYVIFVFAMPILFNSFLVSLWTENGVDYSSEHIAVWSTDIVNLCSVIRFCPVTFLAGLGEGGQILMK